MSDNIPWEIQEQILKRLPVKTLIHFRSVSRAWKAFIDSSDFVTSYSSKQHHLLTVSYKDDVHPNLEYALIIDDHTFPQQSVSLLPPQLFRKLKGLIVIGSSHGLLCFHDDYVTSKMGIVVLWNLSIRKAVSVVVPDMTNGKRPFEPNGIYETILGFGVCSGTADPVVVKIKYVREWVDMVRISCIPRRVQVFKVSTGVWRIPNGNLPRKSVHFFGNEGPRPLHVDGVLYWPAFDRIIKDGRQEYCNLIISFDMISEEFSAVNLPDNLAFPDCSLSFHKLRESLVVLENKSCTNTVVWKMEGDVLKSFTKMFILNIPEALILRGFRKTGEPIVEIEEYRSGVRRGRTHSLDVYQPSLKHIISLRITGAQFSFRVFSYMESLLLLDQKSDVLLERD